jgi:hypothetical protein
MVPGGLDISQHGYALAPETAILHPGETDFRFQILGPDGRPVTAFAPIHDRKLHLIVVRRDLTGFWHVHPVEDYEVGVEGELVAGEARRVTLWGTKIRFGYACAVPKRRMGAHRHPNTENELDHGALDTDLPPRTTRPHPDVEPAPPAARCVSTRPSTTSIGPTEPSNKQPHSACSPNRQPIRTSSPASTSADKID